MKIVTYIFFLSTKYNLQSASDLYCIHSLALVKNSIQINNIQMQSSNGILLILGVNCGQQKVIKKI